MSEGCDVERLAILEAGPGTDGMDAADEAPDPLESLWILELRCPPGLPRTDAEAIGAGG